MSVQRTGGPSVLCYSCAFAVSCCLGIPGLLWSLWCVRQLESVLTLISRGRFLQLPQRCFFISKGEVISGRRVLSRLSLWSCILNGDLELSLLRILFLSWQDYVALFQPLLIQLAISWAGSSNNLSYTLFHPNVPFYLQQDVQALIVWSCFHWQRQKARETSTVLGLHPFKQKYNLCLYVVMSANISGCLLALAHGCCLCWPPAPAEGAVSGHKLRFLQPQGCLAEVREWSFPLCKLVNPGLNFPFSLSADKVGSAVFISLQISLKEHNGVLKKPHNKTKQKTKPQAQRQRPRNKYITFVWSKNIKLHPKESL